MRSFWDCLWPDAPRPQRRDRRILKDLLDRKVIRPAIEIAIGTQITIDKISHVHQENIATHIGVASETNPGGTLVTQKNQFGRTEHPLALRIPGCRNPLLFPELEQYHEPSHRPLAQVPIPLLSVSAR